MGFEDQNAYSNGGSGSLAHKTSEGDNDTFRNSVIGHSTYISGKNLSASFVFPEIWARLNLKVMD